MRQVVGAIVGIAQIIVDIGRNTSLEQFLVVGNGLMVVALGVLSVGIRLGHGTCGNGEQEHQGDAQGFFFMASSIFMMAVIADSNVLFILPLASPGA